MRELNDLRNAIDHRRQSIATLAGFYEGFPNIRAALQDRHGDQVFVRMYQAVNSFFAEVSGLPASLPQNFESALKP